MQVELRGPWLRQLWRPFLLSHTSPARINTKLPEL
jgi:hypothetical protein